MIEWISDQLSISGCLICNQTIQDPQSIRDPLDPRSEIDAPLLPDAETFEDVAEKIVRSPLAGDFLQRCARFLQIEKWKLLGDLRCKRGRGAGQRFSRAFKQYDVADIRHLRLIAE